MATDKDNEQDELIRTNAERIARNEEAIQRQTVALEKIRDHYYPPPPKPWKRASAFAVKVVCVIVAYVGFVDSANWYLNSRKASKISKRCVDVANRLFLGEGDANEAVKFLENAVAMNDANVDYRIELGYVRGLATLAALFNVGRPLIPEERKRVDAALAEATMLQEMAPDNPMPHVLTAQARMLRGEPKLSLEAINRALALDPNRTQVRVSACAMYFYSGDIANARAQIAEAERLNAKFPLVPMWKGLLATVAGDLDAARAGFAEVIRVAPRVSLGHAMMGRSLLAGKNPDIKAARAEFEQALVSDPRLSVALLGMSETYEREGNDWVAKIWLDRAIALDKSDIRALVARARIAGKRGDWDAALADLRAAVDLSPFDAKLYLERSKAYEKLGDAAHAAEDRETAGALAKKQEASHG